VSAHHLEYLLAPQSLAVIGASDRAGSVGAKVIDNVLSGGFRGPVWPVNLRHASVAGVRAYATPAALPAAPDLALICTPAVTIPGLIDELGAVGTRAAVVLSAGLEAAAQGGGTLATAMLRTARSHALRVLGPNCIGVIVPGIGLNASFAHVGARAGGIALIAQSGALISAMLDWAQGAGVGFSHCISLGNAADVDFGDLLDYLGRDPRTRAILLYIESITGARKFMSAARAAARNKPVIAVKAGRTGEAARVATSHSGALAAVLEDPKVDAVLLIHAPTALAATAAVARVCTPVLERATRPAFACWLGAEGVRLAGSGGPRAVPGYATPEEAVDAYLHVMRYHQVQALLMETPTSQPEGTPPDTEAVRSIIRTALAEGRPLLTEPESKALLAAYHIPVVETRIGREISGLAAVAAGIGYPVALKILSADISHKSDVGGVALDIGNAGELADAAQAMLQRCRELRPAARIEGFSVQPMIRRGGAHELLLGVALDPTFGPVVLFGRGGTAVEAIGDRALALPPLNSILTRELIARTRVSRLLAGARGVAPVAMAALEAALMRLAQLACDVAEIAEVDINPLLADSQGVIALDARVRVAASGASAIARLAIRPYPGELDETVEWRGRTLVLRPIRPEDTPRHRQFLARVTPRDLYTRFFTGVRELPEADLAHLTQIDYDRDMAFVAVGREAAGAEEILGVARACADPDNDAAEFAVLVRSDLKGQGLGTLLMHKLIRYCREHGTRELRGDVMSENAAMLHLAKTLGFKVCGTERNVETVALELRPQPAALAV